MKIKFFLKKLKIFAQNIRITSKHGKAVRRLVGQLAVGWSVGLLVGLLLVGQLVGWSVGWSVG